MRDLWWDYFQRSLLSGYYISQFEEVISFLSKLLFGEKSLKPVPYLTKCTQLQKCKSLYKHNVDKNRCIKVFPKMSVGTSMIILLMYFLN